MDQKQEPPLLDAHDIEVNQLQCQDSISCIKFAPVINNPVYQNFGPKMVAVADWTGMISVIQVSSQPNQEGKPVPAVNPVS